MASLGECFECKSTLIGPICPNCCPDQVRHAFRNVDEKDWDQLTRMIPNSGHGKFWKAVFAEVREALKS